VQVIEHQKKTARHGESTQQPGNRIENPKPLLWAAHGRRVGQPRKDLGRDQGELPRHPQVLRHPNNEPGYVGGYPLILRYPPHTGLPPSGPKHLSPWPVWWRAVGLHCPTPQHRYVAVSGYSGQLLGKPGLTHARLSTAQH
jgi:hypothetical protein